MKKYCGVELQVTVEESRLEEFLDGLKATMHELGAARQLDGDITVTPLPHGSPVQQAFLKITRRQVC